jgi:hypothetical protein
LIGGGHRPRVDHGFRTDLAGEVANRVEAAEMQASGHGAARTATLAAEMGGGRPQALEMFQIRSI